MNSENSKTSDPHRLATDPLLGPDAFKTTSKRVIQKTTKATSDLIGTKMYHKELYPHKNNGKLSMNFH